MRNTDELVAGHGVRPSSVLQRYSDGAHFEVVRIGTPYAPERVQLRRLGERSLKNTHWVWADNLLKLYRLV
jgi:hypothetical protein